MTKSFLLSVAALSASGAVMLAAAVGQAPVTAPKPIVRDYPVQPVPFTAVHVNDVFWAPRIEINRTVTIPFAFKKCEETGRVHNFERAAEALQGHPDADRNPPPIRSTTPTSTR